MSSSVMTMAADRRGVTSIEFIIVTTIVAIASLAGAHLIADRVVGRAMELLTGLV